VRAWTVEPLVHNGKYFQARLPERLRAYADGLAAGGHPEPERARLLADAAVWRHVYVAESQAQAEDELAAALCATRRHMHHAREAYNPADFHVDPAMLNPFTDPAVSEDEGVRWSLETGALCGTARRVTEQLRELEGVGVGHVLCQMSFGYLGHAQIAASMRRFAAEVMPAFPR